MMQIRCCSNKAQCLPAGNDTCSINSKVSMATYTVAMHGFRVLKHFCSEKPLHLVITCLWTLTET